MNLILDADVLRTLWALPRHTQTGPSWGLYQTVGPWSEWVKVWWAPSKPVLWVVHTSSAAQAVLSSARATSHTAFLALFIELRASAWGVDSSDLCCLNKPQLLAASLDCLPRCTWHPVAQVSDVKVCGSSGQYCQLSLLFFILYSPLLIAKGQRGTCLHNTVMQISPRRHLGKTHILVKMKAEPTPPSK